jgi:hypothetical protein
MKSLFALAFLLSLVTTTSAQDRRIDLLKRLATAQGITATFELQHLVERDQAHREFERMFPDSSADGRKLLEKMEVQAARERYEASRAEIFSRDELLAHWVESYGRNLPTEDIETMVSYYESPVGRRDTAAAQAGRTELARWVQQERARRSAVLFRALLESVSKAER